ncbi:hypothetical protein HaLaN_32224, partial [Haematococcus lacustris]
MDGEKRKEMHGSPLSSRRRRLHRTKPHTPATFKCFITACAQRPSGRSLIRHTVDKCQLQLCKRLWVDVTQRSCVFCFWYPSVKDVAMAD